MTIEEQIVSRITDAMAILDDKESIKMSIEKLSGLPNQFVPLLTALLAAKNGVDAGEITDNISHLMFDLVLTSVAIGYVEGKRQATETAKAASDTL